MKVQELDFAIKKNGIAPIYLIEGEEDYLRDQALSVIQSAVLGEKGTGTGGDGGLEAFNYDRLYGDESDAAEILARAGEAPVLAPRRLVLLKAADKLPAHEKEALLPYLKNPCDSTTLVFEAQRLDGRQKFTQALKQHVVVVDCSPLFENQLAAWIRGEASRAGVRLNDNAILLLKEVAGGSLYLVRRELEKLAAYVRPGNVAGPAEVESVRGVQPGASVFDLAAAIGARDRGRALRILARNLEAGEAPLRILGSLVWQYRQLWKAKDLLRRGGGESGAARMLRLPPFKVKAFLGQFPEPRLRGAFLLFLKTDSRLKGGSAGAPARVLEAMLLDLCGGAGQSTPRPDGRSSVRDPQVSGTTPIGNVGTVRSERPSAH